ncbi:ADAMTS-like protein 2 [Macrobrachium rosenbergii]|uniref:ADAMTS-like protein 2 n=1 Tax=Macrobrachium rosenbergii TaxID=79674 RepID=UPI0034D3E8B9
MKSIFTLLFLLLVPKGLVVNSEEENFSTEITADESAPDPLLLGGEIEEEEEQEEEKKKRGIGISDDAGISEGTIVGLTGSAEDSEAAARLPKPEALQGGPQTLQGLHIGRIPHSCALCSRERNLCRIISGIFTRSPLPYGYSLVTPIPAGVCNLSITEMKPSKNFFALRRPGGIYVLNGNWDIQAAGQYLIGGTTFTYTPSDEDSGEQLTAPGPLREPIELMLISQSPNPGIKYEYRLPVQDFQGGNPALSSPSGGLLPNVGSISGTLGHSPSTFPQGSSSIGSINPNLSVRNPTTSGSSSTSIFPLVGSQALIPGRGAYGPNNPNIVAGSLGPLNPGITPSGGINRGRGLGGFNPGSVPVQRGSAQSGTGISPATGSQGINPTFTVAQPRTPVKPSDALGTRGSSGIPGVLPHLQPITPLGTSQGSSSLPIPWNPSYSPKDGSPLPGGNPYLPGQGFPRVPSPGSLPPGVRVPGSGLTGQQTDVSRPTITGGSTTGVQGFIPPQDGAKVSGIPPEFPQNSIPLRPVAIPIQPNLGSRRPPSNIPSHSRRPHSEEKGLPNPETFAGTHRTRHQHGGKRRQGHRKVSGTSAETSQETPFGIGIQQTQPNVSPSSFSPSNDTTTAKEPRRRGNGRRRQQQDDSGVVGTGRRNKDRGNRRKQRSRYQWAEKGFTPCSKPCGGGNQTTILSCERRRKKTVVSDRRCEHLPRPKTHTIMCNLKPCSAAWSPGEWSPCSVTCGMGFQTRPLVCKQQISPTFTMVVPEGACSSPPAVPTSQVCEMGRCPSTSPEWDTGPWSNCSAPCGFGSRSREVRCLLGGTQIDDESCDAESQPEEEQDCDMGSCAMNTWFFSEWADQCSESCGTGIQTRKVHCLMSSLADGDCPAETRPEASRTCRGDVGCGGQWFAGPWGDCSSPCGVGRETRTVICVVVTRKGKWRVVDDDQCTSLSRPHDSQECNVEPCAPQWYTSEWSHCSASCEGGVMRREVTCLDAHLRPSADCFNASKPAPREPCNLHPCTITDSSILTTTVSSLFGPSPNFTLGGEGTGGSEIEREDRVGIREDGKEGETAREGLASEDYQENSDEIENELVVEEVSGNALNVIPDKDAQGDESVADEDADEDEDRDDDEEAEKKKRKRKKNKEKQGKGDHEAEEVSDGVDAPSATSSPPTARASCIDRIKNCHLVFRARLCRLKYYNKLCCRTCSAS